jgi:cytochrome c oxidase subunit 2
MCIDVRRFPLAPLAAAAAIACNGTTSYLDATGDAGKSEATLGWWLTGIASAVVFVVCVAILLGIARHRGENNDPSNDDADTRTARNDIKSGLNWIYIGLSITVVILLATFVGTMETLQAASRTHPAPAATLDVTAHQWWWEVRYSDPKNESLGFVTANEINLPVGEPVKIRLHSADVIHSFWIPQLAGKLDVIPGQINEMWLEAKQPGHSRGMCGEYCGMQHAMMALAVTAQSPAEFSKWAAERRAEAPPPSSPLAETGRVVFVRSCAACHAVSGTSSLGRMGPDLTHLASRPAIGAGALDNNAANLSRWILNAPGIKEGVRMPAVPLDSAELQAVVTYLQTLR